MSARVYTTGAGHRFDPGHVQVSQSAGVQRFWFEYFFTTPDSLKEQNKFLFLFLQRVIEAGQIGWLRGFLSDEALRDIHPSLIKSALIMIEAVPDLDATKSKLQEILTSKLI